MKKESFKQKKPLEYYLFTTSIWFSPCMNIAEYIFKSKYDIICS